MPIQIIEGLEPCTLLSTPALEGKSSLIESDAYRQLVHELRRYCNGDINGRSFLIAGHRGAGKTTLVLNAYENILWQARMAEVRLRPLLVPLLGPSLLPHPDEIKVQTDEKTGKTIPSLSEFENVLVQLTLGLYRATATVFTKAYREHCQSRLRYAENRGYRGQYSELLELPSQLALELDEYAGKARLREFWRRVGAISRGVLSGTAYIDGNPAVQRRHFPRDPDQGGRELVALSSVCEAYRRISGSISRKSENKDNASKLDTQTNDFNLKAADLLGPLIPLLVGGAVGTGIVAANGSNVAPAAFTGVLTALATAGVTKFSSTRTQQRSASQEDLFIPDLSVSTLDRVLPLLLERLRDAGLAPVFVIDELDKVEDLSERIPKMVRRLKKLVAESAYFCFLTDRVYFEELRQRNLCNPYSIEYTYFSCQLFVTFRHCDLHNYLGKVLKQPDAIKTSNPPTAEEQKSINLRNEEIADCAILPYVILHAAHMHPIDLRREIARLRDSQGNVALPPGEVRSLPRCRLELQMQVAVETILNSKEMQWELDRDPAFRRLVHDALYYVSRQWERDVDDLPTDEKGREQFLQYLRDRMARETKPASPTNGATQLFTAKQGAFLWDKVRELCSLLVKPQKIRSSATQQRFASEVIDALNFSDPGPLLTGSDDIGYKFSYFRSGRPRSSQNVAAQATPQWQANVSFIRRFNQALLELTDNAIDCGSLASGYGVLATSPAWPSAQTAMARLSEQHATEYSDKPDDISVVVQYAELLRRSSSIIADALFCGAVVGVSAGATKRAIETGIAAISQALSLCEEHEENAAKRLGELTAEICRRTGTQLSAIPAVMTDEGIELWQKAIQARTSKEKPTQPINSNCEVAWDYVRDQVMGEPRRANIDVIISLAKREAPFTTLHLPLESNTLHQWSAVVYQALMDGLTPESSQPQRPIPFWLVAVALRELGFSKETQSRVEAIFGPQPAATPDDLRTLQRLRTNESNVRSSYRTATALIITDELSIAENWEVSEVYGALVWRMEDIQQLRKKDPALATVIFTRFNFFAMVVDLSATTSKQTTAKKANPNDDLLERVTELSKIAAIQSNVQKAAIVLNELGANALPSDIKPVREPKSLDDMFQQLIPPVAA